MLGCGWVDELPASRNIGQAPDQRRQANPCWPVSAGQHRRSEYRHAATVCAHRGLQPPAQPHSRVSVERAIGFVGSLDTEVVGPPAQRAVQLIHRPCGFLPCLGFTRVAACTLAPSPIRDTLIEGFSHFVTSRLLRLLSAGVIRRVGLLSPTGRRRLVTAHTRSDDLVACRYPASRIRPAAPPSFRSAVSKPSNQA